MKLTICYIGLVWLLFSATPIPSHAEEPMDTVTNYLQALIDGTVEELRALLGGRLLSRRKVLLEQNASTSEFLQNFYAGAETFIPEIKKTNIDPLQYEVEVQFQFPTGNIIEAKLVLEQNSLGEWKIVDKADTPR